MRLGPVVGVGLLLMSLAAPASAAGLDYYLLGGMALANLGGDADQFGDAIAAAIQTQAGGSWTSDKKARVGADIGVGVSFGRSDVARAAVELRFVTRGVKYRLRETSGSGLSGTEILKFNYVELPVLLNLRPPVSGSVQPEFVVGPVVGFKSSAKATAEAQGSSQTQDFPSEVIKSAVFGGLVGAGVKIRATPTSDVLLQLRFQAGFTNIVDDPSLTFKSRDFSIMAGWSTAH